MINDDQVNHPDQGNGIIMPSFEGKAYWTEQRLEISSWLRRNAQSLGELYEGALQMVYRDNFPGRTRFIAHAVREIRNRLPDVISGGNDRRSFQWKNEIDRVLTAWGKNGLPLDGSIPVDLNENPAIPNDFALIPIKLWKEIVQLLKNYDDTRESSREAAIRMFHGVSPETPEFLDSMRPVINQWHKVTEWFVGKAHDGGHGDGDIDYGEFQKKFEIFETTLGALLRGFFEPLRELDEILEETNS